MGQMLSSPATEKKTATEGDDTYVYAVSEMQGWRITMEDAHAHVLKLEEGAQHANSFFAVYDGHGGSSVAKYSGEHLHKRLLREETYAEKEYGTSLRKAFLGVDEDIRADPAFFHDPSGCTAVAALFTHDRRLIVANAGDSRCVLSSQGEAKPMSFDHKPTNPVEVERIQAGGGFVEFGRVNGNLALSRALGDFEFKKNYALGPEKQIITSNPDIEEHELTPEDEFLVLACDGIWDCMSSQQVIDFVRLRVFEKKELKDICEELCQHCLAPDTSGGSGGVGCDNMTVMIIAILNGRTLENWCQWVTDRVENQIGYKTPKTVPQIYAPNRLLEYQARRSMAAKSSEDDDEFESGFPSFSALRGAPGAFGGLARVLAGGGISFHPSTGLVTSDGGLMFGQDNDDDSGEDVDGSGERYDGQSSFFSVLGARTPSKSLRAQVQELREDDESGSSSHSHLDEDNDAVMSDADLIPDESSSQNTRQGEAPPPPKPTDNEPPASRHTSKPGGDAPSAAVKAEGLMDTSEDPMKS